MSTPNRLWFPIAQVFEEIHQLCIEARALELVKQRRAAQAAGLQEMLTRLSLMPDPLKNVRFAEAEQLATDAKFQAKAEGVHSKADGSAVYVVDLRSKIRKRLESLKSELSKALTEREVYYCLFPIVIYSDELVQEATRGVSAKWEPLQSELYKVNNGGEEFYTVIDSLLRKSDSDSVIFRNEDTHPLIFEVFYFCLRDGFVGMYDGNAGKVQEYLARLLARIPAVRPSGSLDMEGAVTVTLVAFPFRYYIGSVAAAVGLFLALSMFARYEIGAMELKHEHASSGAHSDVVALPPALK